MTFNSIDFVIFFIVVTTAYFWLPSKLRLPLLLISSCVFYAMAIPIYLFVIFALVVIDYFAGLAMVQYPSKRRSILLISLAANLGMLCYFKYYNFFIENASSMAGMFGLKWKPGVSTLLLPLGLSFHTFQSMAYTLEIYWERVTPETNFFKYALYVLFYPQLVSGPIERPQHLLPQFTFTNRLDPKMFESGIKLMLWGLFKKMVIADRLAIVVDHVYSEGGGPNFVVIIAVVFFAYQAYCDFSGYTDIAIGAARVIGIDLVKNFDFPFSATNISDYWSRAHISLTTWIRDYLYLPLTYAFRGMKFGIIFVLVITMGLSGLWHGAQWTFVFYGLIHGFYFVGQYFFQRLTGNRLKIPNIVKTTVVFSLVTYAFIYFRAPDMKTAWNLSHALFTGPNPITAAWKYFWNPKAFGEAYFGIWKEEVVIDMVMLVILEVLQYLQRKNKSLEIFRTPALNWVNWNLIVLAIFVLGKTEGRTFIYFQF